MKSFLSEFSFYFSYTQTNFRHVFFFFFFFFLAHSIYFDPKKIILNYIKSLCVELLQIFSDEYFETRKVLNCIKSLSIIFCVKMTRYSQTFLNYIQCFENVSILQNCMLLMHWKHYSVKIDSVSFFSSWDMKKSNHFLGCHAIGINSWLILFLVLCVF